MSRRDVLALLRQREGDYVSGQEISDRLGPVSYTHLTLPTIA